MKKSPHRFFFFFFCACALVAPVHFRHPGAYTRSRLAALNWISVWWSSCKTAFRKPTPSDLLRKQQRPQSWWATDPDRCMSGWLHSQRNPQHTGQEIQNECTLVVAFSPHWQKKKKGDSLCWLFIHLPFSTALSSSVFYFFFLLVFYFQPITYLCYQHAI